MADLRDFLQSMSNSAASNVSAPVDGINWLMRKSGLPVSDAPFMGSDWMAQRGLTRPVKQGAASVLGETAGMLAPMAIAAKAPQIARGLLQAEANAMAPRTLNPQTGAIVWHGSPHKFDKFDASKIGTGEGAQAYGHGLYLAENKGVADEYATKLSKSIVDFTNRPITPVEVSIQQKLQSLADRTQSGSKLDEINKVFDSYLSPSLTTWNPRHPQANSYNGMAPIDGEKLARVMELRDAAKRLGRPDLGDSGSLYKVDLPDEHIAKMLDWDKPLSQQHPDVQKALNGIETNFPEIPDFNLRKWMDADPLASTWHNVLQRDLGADPAMIAGTLKDRGIPGIRYLDGGSRGAGQGSSNFVVFPGNEDILKIMERNGKGLLGN